MQTIAIDLTSPWTPNSVTVVASNKSAEALESSSLLGRWPDMWYDQTADLVYSIGGLSYNPDGENYATDAEVLPTLWGFNPQGNGSVDWESQSSNSQGASLRSNIAGGLSATSPTGHYNLGGYIDLDTAGDCVALEEMVSYNSGNQSWYNLTLAEHYMWGGAQYVPIYGASGVILFFGGYWPIDRSVGAPSTLATLDTILIYDIHTNRFFKQQASNPPPGRAYFCSVTAGASNNESYEMCVRCTPVTPKLHTISASDFYRHSFIYGGAPDWSTPVSQSLADDFRSVYILTVPAFQWLEVPNKSPTRRLGHTCSVIGKRQMISIGGTQEPEQMKWDPWTKGLGIFDMTTLNWTNAYDAAAPAYEQPSLVSQFYANGSRYPITWGDPELQSIFKTTNGTNISSGNSSSNSNSNSNSNSGGHNPVTTTNGTTSGNDSSVVGGVIGGIAALAIVGSLCWRLHRYREKEKQGLQSQNPAELQATCRIFELASSPQVHELPV